MRINAVTQSITSELQKIDSVKKAERESKVSKTLPSDRSSISSDAQKLSETKAHFETIASSVAAQPEIRADKVDEVKKKIENGYYNSAEFIDKLADKLLKDFGVQ
jgi:negative regulator of flagellin synthesis FlgM